MSEMAIVDTDAFKRIEDVADLHLKGKSEYAIARSLGIKVVEAKAAIAQWQEMVNSDMDARDAAKDHLNAMVKRYEILIERMNTNLDDLQNLVFDHQVSGQIVATTKAIAEFDKVRVDLLQKAGLLDASDLGDELAEREEREQMLLKILREDLCPDCQRVVRDRITALTQVVEGTTVDE